MFDRGAAFPSTFAAVDAAGYDWLTWRRAPLQATAHLPILQTITLRGHRERQVAWTDELTTLKDYDQPVRQLPCSSTERWPPRRSPAGSPHARPS